MSGTLYLVSTPIGNLEDITLRALRILKEASLIACEDTRQTAKLLRHYGISTPTISCHEHNEKERAEQLIARLLAGESIALVSDAGTPLLSDPGSVLTEKAISSGIPVVPVPGPSALLAAISASGLSTDEFLFVGFLPSRRSQRRKKLSELAAVKSALAFYESPHRMAETLADALEILGPRRAVAARELTKIHEQFLRGSLAELYDLFKSREFRGEMALIIEGAGETLEAPASLSIRAAVEEKMQKENLDKMSALKAVARSLGIGKSEAYRRLQTEEE
jgi:16S rRNA (cytidine1402-2'-O)-methyltransferase